MTASPVETAERLTRRRALAFPILGLIFLAGQPLYFANMGDPASTPNRVRFAAWLVWAIVLLAGLAFAGGLMRSREVRALMEDEGTIANRMRAYAAGFWAGAVSAVALYALSIFENLKGREAIHIILAVSVAVAVIRFGMLERRAHKDG